MNIYYEKTFDRKWNEKRESLQGVPYVLEHPVNI